MKEKLHENPLICYFVVLIKYNIYKIKIYNLSTFKSWYKGIFVVELVLLKTLPVSKLLKENQFSWNVFIKTGTSTLNKTYKTWVSVKIWNFISVKFLFFIKETEYHLTYIFICLGLSTPVKCKKELSFIKKKKTFKLLPMTCKFYLLLPPRFYSICIYSRC